jgi:hypothetical protein
VQVIFQALSLNFQKSGPPDPLSSVSTFHASLSMALRHMIAADPTFETPKGGLFAEWSSAQTVHFWKRYLRWETWWYETPVKQSTDPQG